jgi:hypothetical protein
MKLSIEVYEHGRLAGVSFTEIFRDLAEMARLRWERQQIEFHIVRRARCCCRKRRKQPDYAAVFLRDDEQDGESTRDTAW